MRSQYEYEYEIRAPSSRASRIKSFIANGERSDPKSIIPNHSEVFIVVREGQSCVSFDAAFWTQPLAKNVHFSIYKER